MTRKQKIKPWLYILPALLLILVVLVFPIMYTGYISVTNMNMFHWNDYKFMVFPIMRELSSNSDPGFLEALITTILWTVINMVLQIGIGFMIAVGLNATVLKKTSRIYKTLLMLPWAMPAYISILLWRVGMFNTEFGVLNKLLTLLGLNKVDFLGNNVIAFCSCLALNLWMALPFMISTIDGALQSVDSSLYESATLDGAGFWVSMRDITVPAIKPIIAPAAVMTTFITFKQFDIVYLLTQQRGYMTGANLNTVITYAHQNAFVSNNYGLSSAVSMLLFVIIILFSLITNRSLREE